MPSIRSRSSSVWRAQRVKLGLRSPASASSRLSHTVCGSNTVGFWNFRPMPSAAIAGSSSRVRSVVAPKITLPASGRVLPVMMSIIVVLPAPLGPITARISPGSRTSERLLIALNPSKATETPSRYSNVPL